MTTIHDSDDAQRVILEIIGHAGPEVIPPDTEIDGVIEGSDLIVVIAGAQWTMYRGAAVRVEVTNGAALCSFYRDGKLIEERLDAITSLP